MAYASRFSIALVSYAVGLLTAVGQSMGDESQQHRKAAPRPPVPEVQIAPWNVAEPPRPLSETLFVDIHTTGKEFSPVIAEQWWEAVSGHPLKWEAVANQHGSGVQITGLAKLRAPWPGDAVLRLSLASAKPYKLYFISGEEGIRLHHYPGAGHRQWAAYSITRKPAQPVVIDDVEYVVNDPGLALLATDNGRNARTQSGTIEIRHQDGALILTKGDVRLLEVAMAAPPSVMYLEGESVLMRDVSMYRGAALPDEATGKRPIVMRGNRPALLAWKENLPAGAQFKRLRSGAVRLSANNTEEIAWVSIPLVRTGLNTIDFEIADPSPDSGIYIGDSAGRTMHGIGFYYDSRTGSTGFGHENPQAPRPARSLNADVAPEPVSARRQWLRLIVGGGKLTCLASSDGVHWSHVFAPLNGLGGDFSHIGLYVRPASTLHTIELHSLQVCELDAITSLASAELREESGRLASLARLDQSPDLGAWLQLALEIQPESRDTGQWTTACAIATLVAGCPPSLANALLDALLGNALAGELPLEVKLQLLEDAALLYNVRTPQDVDRFSAHFDALGQALLRAGEHDSFDIVRRAMMTSPIFTGAQAMDPLRSELARAQLLALSSQGRWPDVHRLCRQLKFWNGRAELNTTWPPAHLKLRSLVNWAEMEAAQSIPGRFEGANVAKRPAHRHPLVVRLDKEAYNVQAELRSAMEDQSFGDACRIITSTRMSQTPALVLDDDDPQLFGSLPTTISLAMQDHPELLRSMKERFGSVGTLRVRQAIAQRDLASLSSATLQFYGTGAAAEAHRWLGDRMMSIGRFARAIEHYERAQSSASFIQKQELAARRRLAAAMLGRLTGDRITHGVNYGGTKLTADEFEQLISELLATHATTALADPAAVRRESLSRVQYDARQWAEMTLSIGTDSASVPAVSRALNWPARQTALALTEDVMIITNRFQVTALNLTDGKPRWTFSLAERQGPTHAWPLVPMRPLVHNGQVIVRLLSNKSQPEIYCLDVLSGELLWKSNHAGHVASDPLLIDGELFALAVDVSDRLVSQLTLTALNRESGAIISETPLLELQDQWTERHVCQAAVEGNNIVAAVAGGVVCCNTLGQICWVRRGTRLPLSLEQEWPQKHHQPPIIVGRRVLVMQPGVPNLQCIDLDTGRLKWQTAMPGSGRMFGLVEDQLLVEREGAILSLSIETGRIAWYHESESDLRECLLIPSASELLYLRADPLAGAQSTPTLVWLDARTGDVRSRSSPPTLQAANAWLGPLASDGNRLWCGASNVDEKGNLQPNLAIFELVAAGPATSVPASALHAWTSHVDVQLSAAAKITLPKWMLLAGTHDEKTGLHQKLAGQQRVLVTKASDTPTRLGRWFEVPSNGSPRLLLEIGHDGETQSKINIRADGVPLFQLMSPSRLDAKPWQQLEVDLSSRAGQNVLITIEQQPVGDHSYSYWKRAEVISQDTPASP